MLDIRKMSYPEMGCAAYEKNVTSSTGAGGFPGCDTNIT